MKTQDFYSDMAVEAADNLNLAKTLGVTTTKIGENILRSRLLLRTKQQAELVGKDKGLYYTFDVRCKLSAVASQLISLLKQAFIEMTALSIKRKPTVLVVGLGNKSVEADALGAKVVDRLIITRPLFESSSPKASGLTNLAAFSPSVYPLTGIEACELIKCVADNLKPDIVIAIDSLAASKSSRLHQSFQLTTAGIQPGSGVFSGRTPLNFGTLNVPVIGVGVPLAIYARSIIRDALATYASIENKPVNTNKLLSCVELSLGDANKDMIVTPKAIESIVDICADIIASAINLTFQHTTKLAEGQ